LRKGTINLLLSIICFTFLLLTLIPLFLSYYVGPRITRQVLEQGFENFFQKKVEVEWARITIFRGFGIEYGNVRIPGSDGEEFFQTEAFLLKPWIQSLILGRLRWKTIVLKNPSIHLIRTSEGHINLCRGKKEKADRKDRGAFPRVRDMSSLMPSQLSIRGGRVRFTDFGLSQDPVVTEMEEIELRSQAISFEKPFSFSLKGKFAGGMGEKFSISVKVTGMEVPLNPNQLEFAISLRADSIESRRIWPYIRSAVPFEEMRGLLDLKIKHRGGLTSFRSSGEMKIRQGQFAMPELCTTAVEPKEVSLNYDLEYEKEEIRISRLVMRVPHVSLLGSGSVQRITSSDRSISLEFTTGKTSFKDIRPYLPDRLIPEKLLPFLLDPETQGFLQVEKARVEGPWASLTREGLRKNPEMLSIRMRLDKGSLLVDSRLPPLRNISGFLTLQGDQVGIEGFHGQFLPSHLIEVNGSIFQICSHPRMAVSLRGDLDLEGLLSLLRTNRMPGEVRKALDPIERISGEAKMAGEIRYIFSKPSELSYKGRIALGDIRIRMAGFPLPLSNLEGEIGCDEKEITLSHFKWRMGKSLCHGHASIRGYVSTLKRRFGLSNKMTVSFDLRGEEIRIDDFLPMGSRKRTIQIDPKSIWVNSTITGKVRISKGSFKDSRFENLATSFTAKRGVLRFKYFLTEAPGGFIRCRGWINLRSKRGVSFKLIPKIHHLDMTNVFRIFLAQGKEPIISGTLNLDGIIAGSGDSIDRITRSLKGDLRLQAGTGRIHGLKTHEMNGLPYNQATAQIMIQRGVASTEDLYLDSDVISMVIKGQADLNQRSLDIFIGIRPLQTMDKILSNVPVAGWLLAGKDRSILTFHYRVKGKFNDLRVETGPSQNEESMDH